MEECGAAPGLCTANLVVARTRANGQQEGGGATRQDTNGRGADPLLRQDSSGALHTRRKACDARLRERESNTSSTLRGLSRVTHRTCTVQNPARLTGKNERPLSSHPSSLLGKNVARRSSSPGVTVKKKTLQQWCRRSRHSESENGALNAARS